MKKLALIIAFFGFTACSVEEIPVDDLNNSNNDRQNNTSDNSGPNMNSIPPGLRSTPADPIEFEDIFPAEASETLMLLTSNDSKGWVAEGFEIQLLPGFQSCRLDDMITLNMDGTYNYDGGDILCSAEDNTQLKSGTWILDHDNRRIIIDEGTANEFSLKIESITETEAVFTGSYIGLDVTGQFVTANQ